MDACPSSLLPPALLDPLCPFLSCFAGGDGRGKDNAGEKHLSPTPGTEKDAEQRSQTQPNTMKSRKYPPDMGSCPLEMGCKSTRWHSPRCRVTRCGWNGCSYRWLQVMRSPRTEEQQDKGGPWESGISVGEQPEPPLLKVTPNVCRGVTFGHPPSLYQSHGPGDR